MKKYITLFFKGLGMGAANVIPGVSGGTIALITGIFEELINSIKSFNITAIKLLFKGEFKEFSNYVNLNFLIAVFLGVGVSIISIAKFFEYLFINYPVYLWAYFFGLILASVYFVGKIIEKWDYSVVISFIIGSVVAVGITFLNSATENESVIYLLLCGVVGVCSMILPGLSGSFILILMGNYELVMIDAVSNFRFDILLPVVIGAGIGIIIFSHLLSWVYEKFKNQTISLLTGFILGSLTLLWPWKNEIHKLDTDGNPLLKSSGEFVIQGYDRFIPESFNSQVAIAVLFIVFGIISIWIIEKIADQKKI